MDAGQLEEVTLYLHQAVIYSLHEVVKTLRRRGASLEWPDKKGRTPLILACTREDLYDMVITLLDEGAKLDAYRTGPHGGYPLHHAAKRGLAKVVELLLSRGANPLAVNDDGLTPLDMARSKKYVSVFRIIEDRICLFSGMVRELSQPAGFSATTITVPQWFKNKVLVYVLPTESDPRKLPKNELVIYQNPRDAVPRTVISLAEAEVEEPKFYFHDPILVITGTDNTEKLRLRFLSENEGDKAQLERFYQACAQGTRQTESGPSAPPTLSSTQIFPQGLQALNRPAAPQLSSSTTASNPTNQSKPTTPTSSVYWTPTGQPNRSSPLPPTEPIPDDMALAMAISLSILPASEEGVQVSPSTQHSWDGGRTGQPNRSSPLPPTEPIPDEIALAMAISLSLLPASEEGVPVSSSTQHSWDGGWTGQPNPSSPLPPTEPISDETALAMAINASILSASEEGAPVSQSTQHSWDGGWTGQPNPSSPLPPTEPIPDEIALAMAMNASILSASEEGITVSPSTQHSWDGCWRQPDPISPLPEPIPDEIALAMTIIASIESALEEGVPLDDESVAESSERPSTTQEAAATSVGRCVVCLDAPAEGVCIPCGHLAGCMDCLTEIKSIGLACPVCRASIRQVVKVYAV